MTWRRALRPRSALTFLGLVTVASAIFVSLRYLPDSPAVVPASDQRDAPHFEVPDLADEQLAVRLDGARGQPMILNFWASWCVPCRKELPAFEAVHRRVGDDVTFIGMNHQDSREDAIDLLRKKGVSYRSGFDPRGQVAKDYSLFGMPTTVFISNKGRILATHTGEVTEKQLLATISKLFGVQAVNEN